MHNGILSNLKERKVKLCNLQENGRTCKISYSVRSSRSRKISNHTVVSPMQVSSFYFYICESMWAWGEQLPRNWAGEITFHWKLPYNSIFVIFSAPYLKLKKSWLSGLGADYLGETLNSWLRSVQDCCSHSLPDAFLISHVPTTIGMWFVHVYTFNRSHWVLFQAFFL